MVNIQYSDWLRSEFHRFGMVSSDDEIFRKWIERETDKMDREAEENSTDNLIKQMSEEVVIGDSNKVRRNQDLANREIHNVTSKEPPSPDTIKYLKRSRMHEAREREYNRFAKYASNTKRTILGKIIAERRAKRMADSFNEASKTPVTKSKKRRWVNYRK